MDILGFQFLRLFLNGMQNDNLSAHHGTVKETILSSAPFRSKFPNPIPNLCNDGTG